MEKHVYKFAEDTKLGGVANPVEDKFRIWNGLDKLEKWPEINKMNWNKGNYTLRGKIKCTNTSLSIYTERTWDYSAEKDLELQLITILTREKKF